MVDKKAVTLEQLEIAKNYIDNKDAENIKSADFVDNTIKFYTTEDKSGEAVAEFVLPEEMFLDGSKTEFVSDFTWDITKYPKSTDPELDGKSVLVLAVKSVRTVRYSFISLDSVIAKLVGEDTESASVSVAEDVISLDVKVSELSGNRIVIKNDGLYVGTVDSTPSWTVSTDDEVREMFSVSNSSITLASMDIGSTVKIMENGEPVDYLIVHKGLPSDMYNDNCDGVWLLREKIHSNRAWDEYVAGGSYNDYEESSINVWLNQDFLNSIDEKIRATIKNVYIPHKRGIGSSSYPVGGLSCKIFLLSQRELGLTGTPIDGERLSYFLDGEGTDAINKRIAKSDFVVSSWWTRSPNTSNSTTVHCIRNDGVLARSTVSAQTSNIGVRPAFILPYNVIVDSNSFVVA